MGYQDIIKDLTASQLKQNLPVLQIGDTLKISVAIAEGDKVRQQAFTGILMGIKGSGIATTIRVFRNNNGQIVERIFPLHSPSISTIEVQRHGKVRRAKLYYLRSATGKAGRVKERR